MNPSNLVCGHAVLGSTRWRALASAILPPMVLVAAGVLVYANSLPGVFLFDDQLHIVDNQAIRQMWPMNRLARSFPTRPLLPVTLAMNYAWGGLDATGYHVLNILVHLAAGLAFYGLLHRTLRLPSLGGRFADSAKGIAFAAAILWLVHPLQTQAVTYIVQRCEAMMALFFLLTLYGYLRGATTTAPGVRNLWYAGSFTAYCLGLASKEVMVTVLPVLWLYDRIFLATSWREVLRCRGWLHAAYVLPLTVASTVLIPGMLAGPKATAGFGIQSVSAWEYARSQPGVILHYLRLTIWPQGQCLDYGWPAETRWLTGILLPSLLVVGLFCASVIACLSGRRAGFLGLAFFLILAPTSSIVPLQDLCFEHRMYLPSACAAAVLAWGGYELLRRLPMRFARVACVATVLGLVLVLGALTISRNRVYHSSIAMWTDVVEKSRSYRKPHSWARALSNLGDALLDAGRVEEGVEVLQQALALNPDMAEIHGNLARGLMKLDDLAAARQHCEEAVRRDPQGARFRQQLGLVAAQEGHGDEAERHFRTALQLNPDDPVIQVNLGQCLADQQRLDEAIACFEAVLGRDAHSLDARQRLATALASVGRMDEAVLHARELALRSPADARPHLLLGLIELQRKNERAAVEHLRRAVELDARHAAAWLQLGNALRRLGDAAEAARCYETAVRMDGALAEAHNNLGGILAEDHPSRAADCFARAVKARPDFVEARFNLAASLTRVGRLEEAAEEYQQLLRLRPDFAPARANLQALLEELPSKAVNPKPNTERLANEAQSETE